MPLIGTIGQVGMRKGLLFVVEAFREVLAEVPDAHLLIVGQRDSQKEEAVRYEEQVHAIAESGPCRGQVHFLGRVENIAALLRELTLLVHGALQEPLGRVLLEAAATATPVVATDVGGTCEIFSDAASSSAPSVSAPTAMIVPSKDAHAIARFGGGITPRPREATIPSDCRPLPCRGDV